MIVSKNNKIVKKTKKLQQKKYRKLEKLFIAEGHHLVEEALKAGVVSYVLSCVEHDYDVIDYKCTPEIIDYLDIDKTSQGIIAVCKFFERDYQASSKILLLDNIADPGNLGTIIRSAAAFDFKTIICNLDCVDYLNSKVIRASQGGIFHVGIYYRDLEKFVIEHPKYYYVGLDVNGSSEFQCLNKTNLALIIGSEARGISDSLNQKLDFKLKIAMTPTTESLNAAVSGAIIMNKVYENMLK